MHHRVILALALSTAVFAQDAGALVARQEHVLVPKPAVHPYGYGALVDAEPQAHVDRAAVAFDVAHFGAQMRRRYANVDFRALAAEDAAHAAFERRVAAFFALVQLIVRLLFVRLMSHPVAF